MKDIIDQLGKINQFSSDTEILEVMNKIAANQSDPGLRQHFRNLLNNELQEHQCAINVLAAGMFAICLGGKYMMAGNLGSYQVNPFLHNLRKAMLACPLIREKLKENARSYIFYTEFYESIWSLRNRIAAIAKAHAGADLGSDYLTVLYSLGGFFDKTESEVGLRDAKAAGGTTCVMTARAVYHAAGAKMIGERLPSVGTPSGPQVELGVPITKILKNGNRIPEASMLRDDQFVFGPKGFNDDDGEERNRPNLEVGDIYFIDGDGQFRFLLRSKESIAAHVGIIVDSKGGRMVDTIDGGSGTGARIELNANREVKFVKNLGWTLDKPGKSFTTGNISEVEAFMDGFKTNESVVNWMQQNPKAAGGNLAQYNRVVQDIQKFASNPAILKQLEMRKAAILDGARRLIRELKKGEKTLGQDRVLKGWWKPERYSELRYVGRESLKGWLS
jgi:hypothetical protein